MKIIFFILAAFLAIALATPTPEAEADPQYELTETFMDPYGEMDQYTGQALDADLGDVGLRYMKLCCLRPRHPRCRRFPSLLCSRPPWPTWGK